MTALYSIICPSTGESVAKQKLNLQSLSFLYSRTDETTGHQETQSYDQIRIAKSKELEGVYTAKEFNHHSAKILTLVQ